MSSHDVSLPDFFQLIETAFRFVSLRRLGVCSGLLGFDINRNQVSAVPSQPPHIFRRVGCRNPGTCIFR